MVENNLSWKGVYLVLLFFRKQRSKGVNNSTITRTERGGGRGEGLDTGRAASCGTLTTRRTFRKADRETEETEKAEKLYSQWK